MSVLDHAGHSDGPNSEEVERQLQAVDGYVGILMEGLRQRNLDNCVNLLLVADHGMCNSAGVLNFTYAVRLSTKQ